MPDSLWPHGLQHARLPCPSPTPRACSNSCPLSRWCHPTGIFFHPLLLCLQSFPASVSLSNESVVHIRWPKYWSFASASVFPMNIQDWSPLGWTDWISLQSKGLSIVQESKITESPRLSSPTPQFKIINSSALSLTYSQTFTSIHGYWKNHSFDYTDLC